MVGSVVVGRLRRERKGEAILDPGHRFQSRVDVALLRSAVALVPIAAAELMALP